MNRSTIEQKGTLCRQLANLPNILSISRVVLLPLVWLLVHIQTRQSQVAATLLIFVIFITDTLDGYIAKRYKLETKLGMVLDSVCDKISTAVILLLMVLYINFPLWLFLVVLIRDFINLTANFVFSIHSNEVLKTDYMGRLSFILLSITIMVYSTQWVSIWFYEKINRVDNILHVTVTILMITSLLHYLNYYWIEWKKHTAMTGKEPRREIPKPKNIKNPGKKCGDNN